MEKELGHALDMLQVEEILKTKLGEQFGMEWLESVDNGSSQLTIGGRQA